MWVLFRQDRDNNPEQRGTIRTCFSANGIQCDSPGQRPGKMRSECPKPQMGDTIVHLHYALSGLRRSELPFPGAMPQAFTLCRFAARPFGNATSGDGTKAGLTDNSNRRKFCPTQSHPTFSVDVLVRDWTIRYKRCERLSSCSRIC